MKTKDELLKKDGCFNSNHENVKAGIFDKNPFFDKKDVVQVKYEMIRATSNDEGNVTEIADTYGFSRKSYYQMKKAFENGGLPALIPKKTGPKGAFKMDADVLLFINAFIKTHKNAKPKEISDALETEKEIKVHPRTISRHFKKN
ncbi:MAG: helix-turn-helix domain-containing protein [Streptococcaceae bacterium]|jgi:transposase|nr:helix-turn-helix domain-containing protein [Streptococcaceae bacterium]